MTKHKVDSEEFLEVPIKMTKKKYVGTETDMTGAELDLFLLNQKLGLTRTRRIALLVTVLLLYLSAGLTVSIMAPFYPKVAKSKQLTITENGIVFAGFGAAGAIFAIPSGRMISRIGPKLATSFGLILTVGCSIAFGFLIFINSHDVFLALCCLFRILEGIGQTFFQAGAVTIITTVTPSSSGAVVGWMDSVFSLGMLLGPALGGILYDESGFLVTFVSIGATSLFLFPFALYIIPSDAHLQSIDSQSSSKCWRIFLFPEIWFAALNILCAFLSLGFVRANLGLVLEEYNMNGKEIGLIFLLFTLISAFVSPIWGSFCQKGMNPLVGIIITNICFIAGYLNMGPAPFLPITGSLTTIIIGVVFIGIAMGGCVALPFIYSTHVCIRKNIPLNVDTNSTLSVIVFEFMCLGNLGGPLIGGAVYEYIGFASTLTGFAAINVIVLLIAFVLICSGNTTEKSKVLG